MTDQDRPVWAGFWRRLFAFVIDSLILGLVGLCVGLLLFDVLASLWGPTRLIGFGVCLAYFGLLGSKAGGSATLGMRVLGLRVVSMRGRPIGLPRSLWRALVLQAPFTLNGMNLPVADPVAVKVFGVAAITLVFGVQIAQVILLLFNHPSRRLVHDLVSGTAVVRSDAEAPPKTRSAAPAVAFVVVLLAFAAALGLTYYPLKATVRLDTLTAAQQRVLALPGVLDAGVNDNTTTAWTSVEGTSETTRTLIVTARLRAWPRDEGAEVARVAEAALDGYELAPGQKVRVVLTRGYDIGIASGWRSSSHDYAPPKAPDAPSAPTAPAASAEAPAAPEEAPAKPAEPAQTPPAPEPAPKA